MSEPGLTWDELDQLADYTAGVLTTDEADRVAQLIHTDPRWAAAHRELVAAEPLVQAALHSVAETPIPMPDDVAARLDAALAAARSAGPAAGRRGQPHRVRLNRRGVRPDRRGLRSPALARIAAGVLAIVALGGVAVVARGLVSGPAIPMMAEDSGPGAADMPPAPTQAVAVPPAKDVDAGIRFIASGLDYRADSLPGVIDQAQVEATRTLGAVGSEVADLSVDDSLSALATTDGLDPCLAEIRLAHPGEIALVDFARFEGQPALVVVVRQGDTTTVVAVGPRCGTDGADQIASVRVD